MRVFGSRSAVSGFFKALDFCAEISKHHLESILDPPAKIGI
jgi:hypothetical protein